MLLAAVNTEISDLSSKTQLSHIFGERMGNARNDIWVV